MEFVLMEARFVIKRLCVERAQINDLTRQQAAAVHQLDKAEQKPRQDGDGEQKIREFIRIVVVRGHLILRDRLLDLAGLMEKMSSPSSKNTLIDVSSARPSARVFRMTKLTQKWLR